MQHEKVTLNLSKSTLRAIDHYMRVHSLRKREQVIELALELLREAEQVEEHDESIDEDADDDRLELELGVAQGYGRDDDRW